VAAARDDYGSGARNRIGARDFTGDCVPSRPDGATSVPSRRSPVRPERLDANDRSSSAAAPYRADQVELLEFAAPQIRLDFHA
jgi:hypothetical protein